MSSIAVAILVLSTLGQLPAKDAGVKLETACDTVTLRDGKNVLGELVEGRAGTSLYVRRAWAREHLPEWAERWEAAESATARRGQRLRQDRLNAWRRERNPSAEKAADPILTWIDDELQRLKDPDAWKASPLMLVKLNRSDVKSVKRALRDHTRILRLAWTTRIPNPESMRFADLSDALEATGVDVKNRAPVLIDGLRPPAEETAATWSLRRAATEVSIDSGLRFLRYQGILLPEPALGEPINAVNPAAAIGALKQLLGENPVDPLPGKLREVAARGRVGAMVTRLDMAPDFSSVTVEISLWVNQGADRWVAAGSRSSRVRPDDLAADAGKDLAGDPQVSGAFQMIEAIGLGSISPELKQRSLKMGAATQKALREARATAEADLASLALPVLTGPAR